MHTTILGVVIGFERTNYVVAEDAGSVTICAIIGEDVGMESDRELSVRTITINGGNYRKYIITMGLNNTLCMLWEQ